MHPEHINLTQADYESLRINWTLAVISFTILIYEYVLTFPDEVLHFWPKKLRHFLDFSNGEDDEVGYDEVWRATRRGWFFTFNWASFLFFLNRYISLFGHVPVMFEYFWSVREANTRKIVYACCQRLQAYHQSLILVIQTVVAVLMIMRIYALYERRLWVILLYVLVCCVVVGLSIWAILSAQGNPESPIVVIPFGCGATLAADEAIRLAVAWAGELVFDSFIFGMTLYKTLTLPRGSGIALLSMLIRDGTIYFGIMVVSTLGNMLTFLLGGPLSRGSVTMFTNVISSVMVSRLMLNLRDTKHSSHLNRTDFGVTNMIPTDWLAASTTSALHSAEADGFRRDCAIGGATV